MMRYSNSLSLRSRRICAISKLNRGTHTNSCVVRTLGDFAEDLDCVVMFHWVNRVNMNAVYIEDSFEVCCVIGWTVSIRHTL